MDTLQIIIGLLIVIHGFAYGLYDKYRINKIIEYLYILRGKELDEEDYQLLIKRYTGFFSYIELFPNREGFEKLYTNVEFSNFATKSKKILKYFFITIPLLWTILIGLSIYSKYFKY